MTAPKPAPAKRRVAKLAWSDNCNCPMNQEGQIITWHKWGPGDHRVLVMDLRQRERIVELMARAIACERYPGTMFEKWCGSALEAVRDEARAALAALEGRK